MLKDIHTNLQKKSSDSSKHLLHKLTIEGLYHLQLLQSLISKYTEMDVVGELKTKTFDFTWEIQNFSKIRVKIGDTIYSPTFKIGDAQTETQWRLLLYPYGNTEENKDYLSLYLEPVSINSWVKCYIFNLHLIDDDGNQKFSLSSSMQFKVLPWGFPLFCKRDVLLKEKESLLTNDTLKISCCIIVNPYSTEEFRKETTMLNNYQTLFATAKLSDVTIVIGTKKIPAHKNILSARSTVFSAMFEHDMKEKNTNTIVIDDISFEVMLELLLFIYCGRVRNIQKLAEPLLIAADKYDIISLKAICERTLFESLKIENVCETLVVSDRYNCERLKSESIDFIINNIEAVTALPKFRELKISNAELLEDILCKMAQSNRFKPAS